MRSLSASRGGYAQNWSFTLRTGGFVRCGRYRTHRRHDFNEAARRFMTQIVLQGPLLKFRVRTLTMRHSIGPLSGRRNLTE